MAVSKHGLRATPPQMTNMAASERCEASTLAKRPYVRSTLIRFCVVAIYSFGFESSGPFQTSSQFLRCMPALWHERLQSQRLRIFGTLLVDMTTWAFLNAFANAYLRRPQATSKYACCVYHSLHTTDSAVTTDGQLITLLRPRRSHKQNH